MHGAALPVGVGAACGAAGRMIYSCPVVVAVIFFFPLVLFFFFPSFRG
jgi:hypothetical protein